MSAQDARDEALELWRSGFERHRRGDLRAAVELYRRSIEVCPTAEAHTFLGWAYSHAGYVERAIAECKRAIEVDPDFGNPYFREALKIYPHDARAEGAARMIRSRMN